MRTAPDTLADDAVLTPAELEGLGYPHRVTLARWRAAGKGPPFIRLSEHRIGYRMGDVRRWTQSQTVQPAA
jgi:hypothetical protein